MTYTVNLFALHLKWDGYQDYTIKYHVIQKILNHGNHICD